MEPELTAPMQDYLDMLAVALATGAKWWRQQVAAGGFGLFGGLTAEQLDTFEGHLAVGMAKLVLTNAQQGLSWREWVVQAGFAPDEVLSEAAKLARIRFSRLPKYTFMKLHSTTDQVQVRVMRQGDRTEQQIWPVAA